MPSVCIHIRKVYSEAEETAIMSAVQAALTTAFGVHPEDTNIILMVHRPHRFMCPPDRDDPERYTNITVVGHATRSPKRSAASMRPSSTTLKRSGYRETAASFSCTRCRPGTLPFAADNR